ncbi:hypothetical protein FB446DRAFT_792572 [Lentinula raphanica]|nr:hypothetical protein FB446DRAFT_792572 [Lentinula raphanica]
MSRSVWARNINPGESVNLAPSQDLCITNVALSLESSDLGRTSLTLSFMLSNTMKSSPVTLCTLMLGRTDQLSINLRLIKGGKYILQVEGPNPMSLVGFNDATFLQATSAASLPMPSVAQSSDPIVMGSRQVIGSIATVEFEPQLTTHGMRADTVGSRIEPAETRAMPRRMRAAPVALRADTVGIQGGPFGTHRGPIGMRAEPVGTRAEPSAG